MAEFPHGWGYGPSYERSGQPPQQTLPARLADRFREAPVTVSIVLVTVAVWLVHEALITWASIDTDNTLADTGTGIHGQWWRLATAMVVHFGLLHIALNMLVLWQIGPPVEKVLRRPVFLASYVVCGIGGSVLSDIHYGTGVKSGGASGAIVGVVGILIGNTAVTAWAEAAGRQSRQRWRFNPSVARSLGIQILVWIVFSSLFIPQIDNWAHVGGGVVGLAIGAGVAWWRTEPPGHVPLDG